MSSSLALRSSHDPQNPIPLPERGRITIGSSPDQADLHLISQGVAELHCIIARTKDGGWAVQDMGSEFGTLLDGQRVEVARLSAGQTLLVGSVSLEVFELMTSSEDAAEASPPEDPPAAAPEPAERPPEKEEEGEGMDSTFLQIPGYSVQKTLGRGGMGAVFLARQDRLHRDVALKILSPRLSADTEFVSRFHREAQAAAAFNHPNVVTVYDVGEAGGVHYLAMEYMDGESLEETLTREGRLPWKTVAQMLLGAARGLVYAESRGIVHRDIKPSNLMLNSDAQVKLADLGLAQRDDDDAGDGRVFGTPHFMPPEQIRGEKVDRRSDLYSLGATGYQLLSGYTPFEGVSSREILRAVLTEEFEPLHAHVTGVPNEFTGLIERMISRSPDDRPQSAESVVSHLEALLSGSKTPSAPSLTPAPARSRISGVAVVLILGVCAAGWYVWQEMTKQGPSPEPDSAQSPEEPRVEDPVEPGLEPENGSTRQPTEDDDVSQKLFEIEAENRLLRLRSSEHTLADRQASLLALAREFDGTTAAAMAREEADGVADIIRMENEAAATISSRRDAVLLALGAAADLEADPPRPGDSLRSMTAVPNQDLLAGDEPFQTAREALRVAVCARALEHSQRQFEEAKSMISDPDITAVHDSLQDLVIRLQLPELPPERRPEGFEDLRRIASEARDLLRNLDAHRQQFVTGRVHDDSVAVAATCHAPDGLELNLTSLRPADGATRLEELAARLNTEEARATVTSLAEDLRAAAAALSALTSGFDSWRRMSIADPRPRRGNTDVVSISTEGVDVQGDDGPERVEWEAFADQPDALHQLFHRRLQRDWTEHEERGIAVILRHAAVLNTLRLTREAFSDPSTLRSRDVEKILDAYAPAANWAKRTLQADLLEREVAAANSLTEALLLASEGQWNSATSDLVHTSRTYTDTLLLLMLSDGSRRQEADSEALAPDDLPGVPSGLDPEGPDIPSPPDPGGE